MASLEHINLIVTDIDKTLNFLKTALPHWQVRGGGEDEWYGKARRWLHVGDNETYLTLNHFLPVENNKTPQRDREGASPGLAHIGFTVPSIDRVVERLKDAGHTPSHTGEAHPHRRNVYYIDDEGIEFEFVEYLSDAPAEKNLYA